MNRFSKMYVNGKKQRYKIINSDHFCESKFKNNYVGGKKPRENIKLSDITQVFRKGTNLKVRR